MLPRKSPRCEPKSVDKDRGLCYKFVKSDYGDDGAAAGFKRRREALL